MAISVDPMVPVETIVYNDPAVGDFDRFARYYDLDYGDYRADVALYIELARRAGSPVLEIGCGTGRLLLPLAATGCAVTGIDISGAMLAVAAEKVGKAGLAARVQLVEADARTFQLSKRFTMAFIATNSFMHFVTRDDQLAVLARVAEHLRPGGILVVDLFNPDPQQLVAMNGTLAYDHTKTDPATGRDVSRFSSTRVDTASQRIDVVFFYDEAAADGRVKRTVAPFEMHYFWRCELELLLERAGYHIEQVYGSHDLEEHSAESPRLIVVATTRRPE